MVKNEMNLIYTLILIFTPSLEIEFDNLSLIFWRKSLSFSSSQFSSTSSRTLSTRFCCDAFEVCASSSTTTSLFVDFFVFVFRDSVEPFSLLRFRNETSFVIFDVLYDVSDVKVKKRRYLLTKHSWTTFPHCATHLNQKKEVFLELKFLIFSSFQRFSLEVNVNVCVRYERSRINHSKQFHNLSHRRTCRPNFTWVELYTALRSHWSSIVTFRIDLFAYWNVFKKKVLLIDQMLHNCTNRNILYNALLVFTCILTDWLCLLYTFGQKHQYTCTLNVYA